MKEEWKDITYYIESLIDKMTYKVFISNTGKIKIPEHYVVCVIKKDGTPAYKKINEKIIDNFTKNWSGYYSFTFCNNQQCNRRRTNQSIHRLVWIGFNGVIKDETLVIDHIDGNRYNNNLNNLRLTTCKGNVNNPITKKRLKEKIIENYNDPIKGPLIKQKISERTKKGMDKPELKKYLSDIHKNRTHINNGIVSKVVLPNELEYYLNNGWKKGRIKKL